MHLLGSSLYEKFSLTSRLVLFASSLDWKSLECRLRWSTCSSSLTCSLLFLISPALGSVKTYPALGVPYIVILILTEDSPTPSKCYTCSGVSSVALTTLGSYLEYICMCTCMCSEYVEVWELKQWNDFLVQIRNKKYCFKSDTTKKTL